MFCVERSDGPDIWFQEQCFRPKAVWPQISTTIRMEAPYDALLSAKEKFKSFTLLDEVALTVLDGGLRSERGDE